MYIKTFYFFHKNMKSHFFSSFYFHHFPGMKHETFYFLFNFSDEKTQQDVCIVFQLFSSGGFAWKYNKYSLMKFQQSKENKLINKYLLVRAKTLNWRQLPVKHPLPLLNNVVFHGEKKRISCQGMEFWVGMFFRYIKLCNIRKE